MGTRLFVGNISFKSTEDDIRSLFATAGLVKDCHIVIDRDTNRSKGFGFVEMGTDDEAKVAVDTLNGKDVGGRQLNVSEARPRAERPAGGFGGGYGNSSGGNTKRW